MIFIEADKAWCPIQSGSERRVIVFHLLCAPSLPSDELAGAPSADPQLAAPTAFAQVYILKTRSPFPEGGGTHTIEATESIPAT